MAKVVVAGSINMDVVAKAEHHPVPGETVAGRDLQYFPGGKGANQAVAAARAGARVIMCGAVGDDEFGPELLKFLEDADINISNVEKLDGPSGVALIVVADDGENTIVVTPGANGLVDVNQVAKPVIESKDILLSQYEIPTESVKAFFAKGVEAGATCILNPSPVQTTSNELLSMVDYLIVNEGELAMIAGTSVNEHSNENDFVMSMNKVLDRGLRGTVITTIGSKGLLTLVDRRLIKVNGRQVNAVDTTGAGDCFAGSFASSLAAGSSFEDALKFANAAAALSVQTAGAGPSMPDHEAILRLVADA